MVIIVQNNFEFNVLMVQSLDKILNNTKLQSWNRIISSSGSTGLTYSSRSADNQQEWLNCVHLL